MVAQSGKNAQSGHNACRESVFVDVGGTNRIVARMSDFGRIFFVRQGDVQTCDFIIWIFSLDGTRSKWDFSWKLEVRFKLKPQIFKRSEALCDTIFKAHIIFFVTTSLRNLYIESGHSEVTQENAHFHKSSNLVVFYKYMAPLFNLDGKYFPQIILYILFNKGSSLVGYSRLYETLLKELVCFININTGIPTFNLQAFFLIFLRD